ENRFDDNAYRTIGWEAGCLVHHRIRRPINLRGFIETQEIDAAAEQRWQLRQLPDVSQLEQEVFVHQQFIDAIRHQTLRPAQRKLRQAGVVVVESCPPISVEKDRGRFVQPEKILGGDLRY